MVKISTWVSLKEEFVLSKKDDDVFVTLFHTMVQSLIAGVLKSLNTFPSKGSISETMSPSMILEGKPNSDMSKQRIAFGSYALCILELYETFILFNIYLNR